MRKSGFTLIEVIMVLVIISIVSLITTVLVFTIINKTEKSADKRSVDLYGHSLELALNSYELQNGLYPDSIDLLKSNHKGNINCVVEKIRKDGTIFLSQCSVNGNKVKDRKTDDRYYHYGKSDIEYIDEYGAELVESIKQYYNENGQIPQNIDDFNVEFENNLFGCDTKMIEDNRVIIKDCYSYNMKNERENIDYQFKKNIFDNSSSEIEVCYAGDYYFGEQTKYKAYENSTISEFSKINSIGENFRVFIPNDAISCSQYSRQTKYGTNWYIDLNNCTYSYRNMIQTNISPDAKIKPASEGCYISDVLFYIPTSREDYPTCLWSETEVIVYDKKKKKKYKKKIKDLTEDDLILVWDFDKGEFTFAKPLWVRKCEIANYYYLLKFSDGSELKIIHNHKIYNVDTNKFESGLQVPIGTNTFTSDGKIVKLISRELVNKKIEFSTVVTKYHMNLFTNNILTSIKLNNMYPIEDMKFIKNKNICNDRNIYNYISDEIYNGLRIKELDFDNQYNIEDINDFILGMSALNKLEKVDDKDE